LADRIRPLVASDVAGIEGDILFFLPVGYYLRGLAFQKSQWGEAFYIWSFVRPLHGVTGRFTLTYSRRMSVPGTEYDQSWDMREKDFEASFAGLLEAEACLRLQHMRFGSDCKSYLEYRDRIMWEQGDAGRRDRDWPNPGIGWANLHMGYLAEAREIFAGHKLKREEFYRACPGLARHDSQEEQNITDMLERLDGDPAAIPDHCEELARQSMEQLKLEKYWQPTPFWGPAERKRALSSRSKR
jgi:hypothetical protein